MQVIREKHATFLCSHNCFDFNYIYPDDSLIYFLL